MASTIYRLTSLVVIFNMGLATIEELDRWQIYEDKKVCLKSSATEDDDKSLYWPSSLAYCKKQGGDRLVFVSQYLERWHYYKPDKTCLRIFGKDNESLRLTWSEGRADCHEKGGDLAMIHDKDKQREMFDALIGNPFVVDYVWIGVKNDKNAFKYVDNSSLSSYQPWQKGVKLSDRNKKCVGSTSGWYNFECDLELPYMCSVPVHGHKTMSH